MMRQLIRLTCLGLSLSLAACSGPIFGARGEESAASPNVRERAIPPEELLAIQVDTLPLTSDGVHQVRRLGVGTDTARESQRPALRAHRGQVLADLVVLAYVWSAADPIRSEWYAAAAGLLVERRPSESGYADAVVRKVDADLAAGGIANRDEILNDISVALGLEYAPSGRGARTALVRLAEVADALPPWLRYGDAADDGRFARVVNAYRPTAIDAQPLTEAGLDSQDNLHVAQALMATAGLCDDARSFDEPVTRAAAEWIAGVDAYVRASAVPIQPPSTFLTTDPTLSPPHSFGGAPSSAGRGLGELFRRTILVRTDGVYGMVSPHVAVSENGLHAPAVDAGWGFPGRLLLPFDGFGAVPNEAVVEGELPGVATQLNEMETFLADVTWLPPESTRDPEGTPPRAVGLSLIADGDTYFSTLRPLLESLRLLNYSPIALHTFHPESGALDAVAVRLVPRPEEDDHVLIVREDGYILQPYDPDAMSPPTQVSRVVPNALLVLHNTLAEGFADGTLDPSRPLTVQVDDNSVDYAILSHMLAAIGFARSLDDVSSDSALLRAPIALEGDLPRALAPAGLRLSL